MSRESELGRVVRALDEAKCIMILDEPVVLKSGISTQIYAEVDKVISHPEANLVIVEAFTRLVEPFKGYYHHLVGVPTGMTIINSALAYHLQVSQLAIRDKAKDHGVTKDLIIGDYKPGEVALITEDTLTRGISTINKAYIPLKEAGLLATQAVVLVDRLQGGRHNLKNAGLELTSYCTMPEILAFGKNHLNREYYGRALDIYERELAA